VKWLSNYDKCDICGCRIKGVVPYFVDGKTKYGPWGLLCPECHKQYGVGVGYGIGQKYNGKTGKLMAGGRLQTELEYELEGEVKRKLSRKKYA